MPVLLQWAYIDHEGDRKEATRVDIFVRIFCGVLASNTLGLVSPVYVVTVVAVLDIGWDVFWFSKFTPPGAPGFFFRWVLIDYGARLLLGGKAISWEPPNRSFFLGPFYCWLY